MPESGRPRRVCGPRTVILNCTLVIFDIVFIAQGVIGLAYNSDCPRQPFIPVYLVFFIFIPALLALSSCCNWCNIILCSVSIVFYICWFIAGNVLMYSIYEPNYNKNTTQADPYCNRTLYLFAFWSTNLTYILLGVLFFSYFCCKRQEADDDDDDDDTQRLLRG
ncbi:transmembrane protein 272-like [Archocentrus centrarchus]|uniref:transmembrane protein 272-like n=1 Tax=Archocentrus centrarchus TaxID=63155 RepID=UPI0011EA0751|nr:transmembrane protein 272-like [Archocentrus centrarchus]